MSVHELVKFGLFAEAVTFPDLPMPEAVDHIILAAEAGKLNLSSFIPAYMSPDPLGTMRELQRVLPTLPHDNNQIIPYIFAPIITVITLTTTIMRLYGRKTMNNALKKADWCAALAAFFSVALCVLLLLPQYPKPNHNGASGRHVWDVSFAQFRYFTLVITINEVLFSATLLIVRLAWLIFYYELSPNTSYRRLIAGTGTLILIISVLSIPLIIFQCKPIDIWHGKNLFTAKCIEKKKAFTAMGALTMITDVMLLLLPITLVMRLKRMRTWEKVQIVAIFSTGGFICVLTLMRVLGLNEIVTNIDSAYANTPTLCWGIAELDAAIIVSNLPMMRSLMSRWYHGRNKGGVRSSFVLRTDGERAWKVEEGFVPPNLYSDDESKGNGTPGGSSRGSSNRKKGVTDSSLFRGSLFRDTIMKSRGEDSRGTTVELTGTDKETFCETVDERHSGEEVTGGNSRDCINEVKRCR